MDELASLALSEYYLHFHSILESKKKVKFIYKINNENSSNNTSTSNIDKSSFPIIDDFKSNIKSIDDTSRKISTYSFNPKIKPFKKPRKLIIKQNNESNTNINENKTSINNTIISNTIIPKQSTEEFTIHNITSPRIIQTRTFANAFRSFKKKKLQVKHKNIFQSFVKNDPTASIKINKLDNKQNKISNPTIITTKFYQKTNSSNISPSLMINLYDWENNIEKEYPLYTEDQLFIWNTCKMPILSKGYGDDDNPTTNSQINWSNEHCKKAFEEALKILYIDKEEE